MRFRLLLAALLVASPLLALTSQDALAKDSQTCKRGCNSRCHGVQNKAKCVAQCRRACG
jgi:hypothetical protein